MSSRDLADLLKDIVNSAVDVMGGSLGIVKEVKPDEGVCEVQPDDGSPIVNVRLHKGQKPKVDSKVAFITTHIDSVEEDNYTILHIFDYDEHLVKANKKVILEVEDNKLTVVKGKTFIGYKDPDNDEENPAVLGKELVDLLKAFKEDIVKHTHPYPGTPPLPSSLTNIGPANLLIDNDIEAIWSEKVFLVNNDI